MVSLPAEPELPDSMFVEDPAVVTAEVAVMTRMGAESRRREAETLAPALARYRPLHWMREPATLEGGDVLRIGKSVFAGLSARTNQVGVEQLAAELGPFGYSVRPVAVSGCLHLKSAVCYLGEDTVLANTNWFDTEVLEDLQVVVVPAEEPHAANVLAIGNTVLVSAAFPRTADLLSRMGWNVRTLDISELMKAEAGLTCSSILLEAIG